MPHLGFYLLSCVVKNCNRYFPEEVDILLGSAQLQVQCTTTVLAIIQGNHVYLLMLRKRALYVGTIHDYAVQIRIDPRWHDL